jgi:Domain of unknown function (DUF3303)
MLDLRAGGWGLPQAMREVNSDMLFMVIERFGDAKLIGERFRSQGRMLPEGVVYHTSWVETSGSRCFQLMEAPSLEALAPWISRWDDLADFEIFPVLRSEDFWSALRSLRSGS